MLQGKCGDVGVFGEKKLTRDVFQTQSAHGCSGRLTGNCLVNSVKMVGRECRPFCQYGEVERFAVVLFEVADDRAEALAVINGHLANQPAFAGVFEEFRDTARRFGFAGERVDFVACLVQEQVFAVEVVMAALDGGDVVSAEVVAF